MPATLSSEALAGFPQHNGLLRFEPVFQSLCLRYEESYLDGVYTLKA